MATDDYNDYDDYDHDDMDDYDDACFCFWMSSHMPWRNSESMAFNVLKANSMLAQTSFFSHTGVQSRRKAIQRVFKRYSKAIMVLMGVLFLQTSLR